MSNLLLPFSEYQNSECICAGLVDPEDITCFALDGYNGKYQLLDEHSPFIAQALADCEGLGFQTVKARPFAKAHTLPDFIPVVTPSSQKLFEHFTPPYVGVMIGDIVSNRLTVNPNIRRRMGIPPETKIILLCYGLDELIENIWPYHRRVFEQLLQSDIDLIVPINYSVWHSQPHLERLVNIKRSFIVYRTLQELGFETIPHMYWSGATDIRRLADWFRANPCVTMLAIDLQTIGNDEQELWLKSVEELANFAALLGQPMHYLISGPQSKIRIQDITNALGSGVSFTNGCAEILAWHRYALMPAASGLRPVLSLATDKSTLFAGNFTAYTKLIRQCRAQLQDEAFLQRLSSGMRPAEIERLYARFRSRQPKPTNPHNRRVNIHTT
jgi:hypothetical protein